MSSRALLIENLRVLSRDMALAQKLLSESHEACLKIGIKTEYSRLELVEYEAFASRFARASDLLLQKLYRAIDSVELVGGGTLIDALNRAQKRKLIDSLEQMYSIRELRNWVAHEYLPKGLQDLFANLLEKTPLLLSMIQQTLVYCQKLSDNN